VASATEVATALPARFNTAAMLLQTPFHPRTAPLCASHAWRRWSGFLVASAYELSYEHEYHAIRTSAGLLDISPLYKYRIAGPDAARLLDRIVTRDVKKVAIGQVLYSTWCDARGKVIDDGTIARLGETTFRMTAADPGLRWLEDNAVGLQVTIDDVSTAVAALALQGPNARAIVNAAAGQDLSGLRFFRIAPATIRGVPVEVSRTGYTGDLGYEIWMPAEHALVVWDALIEVGTAHGIAPAGLWALDNARLEAGLMLIDVDYVSARKALIESQYSTPFELDLAWTVDLDKEMFVGKAALADEKARGPAWKFVGIEVDWPSYERLFANVGLATRVPMPPWRASVPIYAGARQVGYATSGGWSSLLKKYIALAHLEATHAVPGTRLDIEMTVEHRRKRALATVVKKPFFDPERKRA